MLTFALIHRQADFIKHYHYNENLAQKNMPDSFPCIIINFHRYLGFMCGYVKLYTVHYIPDNTRDTEQYFNTFSADPCDKPFIDNVLYDGTCLSNIHINNVGSTNFDPTRLIPWKAKPRHRVNHSYTPHKMANNGCASIGIFI
jgi:hypothetical protein